MSKLMKKLKSEITCSPRKETKQANMPTKRLISVQRRQLARMCGEIVGQLKKMDRMKRSLTPSGMVFPLKEVPRCRFSITGKGVTIMRRKLGLTQAQFGKLAGISVTTVAVAATGSGASFRDIGVTRLSADGRS